MSRPHGEPNIVEYYEHRYPHIARTMGVSLDEAATLCRCSRSTIAAYRSAVREREGRPKRAMAPRERTGGEAAVDTEDRLLAALVREHFPLPDGRPRAQGVAA